MSYIRTHNLTKTLLAILLGLPFVLGVFSNVRPAPQTSIVNAASYSLADQEQRLFPQLPAHHG